MSKSKFKRGDKVEIVTLFDMDDTTQREEFFSLLKASSLVIIKVLDPSFGNETYGPAYKVATDLERNKQTSNLFDVVGNDDEESLVLFEKELRLKTKKAIRSKLR